MVFLITFNCYGQHLPGDPKGSWDHRRRSESRFVPGNPGLEKHRRSLMRQPPYVLSTPHVRAIVRDAIVEVCRVRLWPLYVLHVRPTHVHGVVEAVEASQVVNAWKAYATRALRSRGLEEIGRVIWAHGANSRRIFSNDQVRSAIRYVLERQGDLMESYLDDHWG